MAPKKQQASPCERYNQGGTKCGNTTTRADGWCGQCHGLTQLQAKAASDPTLKSAANAETADNSLASHNTQALADGSGSESTAELVTRLSSSVSLLSQEREASQIQGLVVEAAQAEDAVLGRHPDPLGAALVEASWADPAMPKHRTAITHWIRENLHEASPEILCDGLNQLNPKHAGLVSLAVARHEFIQNPSHQTQRSFQDAALEYPEAAIGSKDPERRAA